MARDEFGVDVDTSEVDESMDRIARASRDTGPLMDVLAEALLEGVLQNYDREQGPDAPWVPLAEATQEERQKRGYGANSPKLVRSRQLRSSILPFSDRDSAQVATNKIYAPIQYLGGTPDMPPGPAAVPARNPMWINPETSREIDAEVDDWWDEDGF